MLLPAAEAMWREHVKWRKEYGADDPLNGPLAWADNRPPEGHLCAEWYPVGRHGRRKRLVQKGVAHPLSRLIPLPTTLLEETFFVCCSLNMHTMHTMRSKV